MERGVGVVDWRVWDDCGDGGAPGQRVCREPRYGGRKERNNEGMKGRKGGRTYRY